MAPEQRLAYHACQVDLVKVEVMVRFYDLTHIYGKCSEYPNWYLPEVI